MKQILLIVLVLIGGFGYSQSCDIKGKKDWRKVKIKVIQSLSIPDNFDVTGESFLSTKNEILSEADLTEAQKKKIKKKVAKYKHCLVFIDIKKLYDPSPKGLYYYWGVGKEL